MADDLRLICWETPDRLAFGIQVSNPVEQVEGDDEILVQLDTGYSGELLMPYDLFTRLALNQWRLPSSVNATTVTGETIQLFEAHAQVIIPKIQERQRIIAQTFQGSTRFLIGRAFLRRSRVLLDGPNG
jgi:predicted aspartyl protease